MHKTFDCAVLLLMSFTAAAFNDPEDKDGPLWAKLTGPAEITAVESPASYELVLQNESDRPLQGTARITVIDDWRVEGMPHETFVLAPRASTILSFTIMAGKGSYNAWYPIHARVDGEQEGAKHHVHPILLVRTDIAAPPIPEYHVPWTPLVVPENGQRALSRLPVHRILQKLFSGEVLLSPTGWRGTDPRTRCVVQPSGMRALPDARRTLFVHPPWHGGHSGALFIEFPIALPSQSPARFECGVAIEAHQPSEPPSDGVTFRVRVLSFAEPDEEEGIVLFETHTDSKIWQPVSVDLSDYAGQTIRLQLETHPGPDRNMTCDRGLWGDPRIMAGLPTSAPAPADLSPTLLGTLVNGNASYEVAFAPGKRGLLDGRLVFKSDEKQLALEGFAVTVLDDALEAWDGSSELVSITTESATPPVRIRHQFRGRTGLFDLIGEISLEESKAVKISFFLENEAAPEPWRVTVIEDASLGKWSRQARQIYAGMGNVIRNPEPFTLHFDGHQLSTSFIGLDFENAFSLVQATPTPPSQFEVSPESGLYTLHVPIQPVMLLIPAPDVWQAVRVWRDLNGLKAAPGVERLAGRFVFDLWGGSYGDSAKALQQAFRYGLTHSAVVWHNWQRWGYDYRLPDIFPPNPQMGNLEEFQQLAQCCREHDVLFAPHDNYIDFYPDAEDFSYTHIGFNKEGHPIWAWLNEYRKAQSFRWNAEAYRPFLEHNVALIRDAVAPTAYFIDVWSSIGPYESWTHDGKFQDRLLHRQRWGESFAWIRSFLGGNAPQISESGHDQLIGYLDGAQTNHLRVDPNPPGKDSWMVWRIHCEDAERIPWSDMAHHDRFVLHGAGYESRYCGGLRTDLHGIFSDDYISTEVLTGHPGMVPVPFGRNVARKYYLLNDLMTHLALKSMDSVAFDGDDLHRQQVRWQDGGRIWVNRGDTPWAVDSHLLPQYGFYAEAGDVAAAIEYKDNAIVEWSRAAHSYYVNARPIYPAGLPVRVALKSLRLLENRLCEATLEWQVSSPINEDLSIYVHFVDKDGGILFQADHRGELPTRQWAGTLTTQGRCAIPQDIHPGDEATLLAGLWQPGDGRRPIQNSTRSDASVRLATIRFLGADSEITNLQTTPMPDESEPFLARMNRSDHPIDFGGLITQGGCRMVLNGDRLTLIPLPESQAFDVLLASGLFSLDRTKIKEIEVEKLDGTRSTMKAKHTESHLVIHCLPEDFAYHCIIEP